MPQYPAAFEELMAALRQLPSVGARSAERLALFLVQAPPSVSERLAGALLSARERLSGCPRCGFFAQGGLCSVCTSPSRDTALWCIVEQPADVLRLEKSGVFKGLYHVLGGRLSPLDGVGPEHLRIEALQERFREEGAPAEVVLALGADVEGETTALYLTPMLKESGVRVSRLATGLPAGGALEFADSITLSHALAGRREV